VADRGKDTGGGDQSDMSWFRRQMMKVLGPPDLGPDHQGNPLTGTKYDPEIKRAQRAQRKNRDR
jgi:hypothetical protein